jgi:hypothetical protein
MVATEERGSHDAHPRVKACVFRITPSLTRHGERSRETASPGHLRLHYAFHCEPSLGQRIRRRVWTPRFGVIPCRYSCRWIRMTVSTLPIDNAHGPASQSSSTFIGLGHNGLASMG